MKHVGGVAFRGSRLRLPFAITQQGTNRSLPTWKWTNLKVDQPGVPLGGTRYPRQAEPKIHSGGVCTGCAARPTASMQQVNDK